MFPPAEKGQGISQHPAEFRAGTNVCYLTSVNKTYSEFAGCPHFRDSDIPGRE